MGQGVSQPGRREARPIGAIVQDVTARELGGRGFRPPGEGTVLRCHVQNIFRKFSTGLLAERMEGSVALVVELVSPAQEVLLQARVVGRSEHPVDLALGAEAQTALEAAIADAVARLATAPAFIAAWAGGTGERPCAA